MGERTSREMAGLHSIEAPPFRPGADHASSRPEAKTYVEAARSAVRRSRVLLAQTNPKSAAWARYLSA